MFRFLFCSFFIQCVFLSHNVIWKQFLPTAGFAFPIGKHVKWKAGKDAACHQRASSPPAWLTFWGLSWVSAQSSSKPRMSSNRRPTLHSLLQRGQCVLWGRHFLNTLQIKWIRCRPDSSLPGSLRYMWGPTEQHLPKFPPPWCSQNLWAPGGAWEQSPGSATVTKASKEKRGAQRALSGSAKRMNAPQTHSTGTFP